MSLMTFSNDSADSWTIVKYSRCSGEDLAHFEQQIGNADNRIHRRADFVAHVGHEQTLGSIGRLGRILGAAQGILSLLRGR